MTSSEYGGSHFNLEGNMSKIKVNFDMKININTYKDIGIGENGDVVDGGSRLLKRINETMKDMTNVEFEINIHT